MALADRRIEGTSNDDLLMLVALPRLMALTDGRPEIRIGLIDGPVMVDHPNLAGAAVQFVTTMGSDTTLKNGAYQHGTSVAGILVARRESAAPAICPGATLLIRPLFSITSERAALAVPDELGSAIIETVDAGARLLNLSLSLAPATVDEERRIQDALNYAHNRGVIVVAAAGNQATIGGSVLTRHPSVVPVVAYDQQGHPAPASNFGRSIGQFGVGAPGVGVTSLAVDGGSRRFGGTSAAAAFVTGTIALLWSEFPKAPAAEVRLAVVKSTIRRVSVVPPLLNAWAAFEKLQTTTEEAARW